jgi:hypothetical protein
MRSLSRAVLLIVSPIAGLPADRFGFGQAHTVAAAILAAAQPHPGSRVTNNDDRARAGTRKLSRPAVQR